MSTTTQPHLLPAFAFCGALAFISFTAFAQAPVEAPVPAQLPSAPPQVAPKPEDLGDSRLAQKRYQAAIAAYKQAPQDSADVWNKMGIAYQMMFNLQDASRCYRASLRLNPRNPHVLNNLGTVYDSLKQYPDAERSYHKAIHLDPRNALVFKNLGTALIAEHKYKKGWDAYKAALAIDPQIFQEHQSPRVENPSSVADRGAMNYYMAKGCVRAGMNDCAIDYLRLALNEGYTNTKKIEADREFAALRGIPAFEKLLAAQGPQ